MNPNPKTRTLALANGILGIAGGVLLIFATFLFAIAGGLDAATDSGAFTILTLAIFFILKLTILILGIVATIYYKDDRRVSLAPSVLFIVSGAISLIPFLGWIGGILAITGGGLYLSSLSKFHRPPLRSF